MQTTGETMPMPASDHVAPPSEQLTAQQWAKRNLFNTKMNGVITCFFVPVVIYLLFRLFRFIFITGQWDPVDANLELLMIAQFPRDETNRIVVQIILVGLALGLAAGLLRSAARSLAEETGEPFVPTPRGEYLRSFWSIGLLVVVVLAAFTHTFGPTLVVIGAAVAGVAGWWAGAQFKGELRSVGWTIAALVMTTSFQALSGTGGWAWGFTALALLPALSHLKDYLPTAACMPLAAIGAVIGLAAVVAKPGMFTVIIVGMGLNGLFQAVRGDARDGAQMGALMLAGAALYFLMGVIDYSGVDWELWGGFHLNAVVTVGATLLAFPLGILLAMGRRSDLPVVKAMSVAYIELFRGVPLITMLLAAQFFLGFFLKTEEPLSLVTRAMAAITLFSAAYIAEIIRGGLQAVPKGQIEAGQAMGMSKAKIMRLIVLPQALRAVVPAMVGQFISLFKDTTLLSIIALPEFLGVRSFIHSQEAFRTVGIAETLTFAAFGFWAVAFSMSRESQRLERRLGVGVR